MLACMQEPFDKGLGDVCTIILTTLACLLPPMLLTSKLCSLDSKPLPACRPAAAAASPAAASGCSGSFPCLTKRCRCR